MERGRAIPEERPSDVTMALLHEGLQQERRAAGNKKKIQKRSIKAGLSYRWPNGRVPYKIESIFSSSDREKIASVCNTKIEKQGAANSAEIKHHKDLL